MALKKTKIGKLIAIVDKKNDKDRDLPFYGINKEKVFMPTIANTTNLDRKKYKIMTKGYFVFSGMQTGRDMCLRVGLYNYDFDSLISPAYTTFKIVSDEVLPEYFFMRFLSKEMDRYCAFLTDSSVRANLDWNVFCDMDIDLPPLPVQKKFVDIYNAMVANQKSYEDGIEDLKLVCDVYIEELRRNMPCEKIGPYIIRRDERNKDNKITNVKSVSVLKEFNTPSSKVNTKELKNYKIVEPDDIAFVQTTHNEKLLCCAVNNTDKQILVTSVNEVFSTNEKLDSNYLMLFLCRKEFDRYARYHSWGSVRETFNWGDMENVEIPIPDIKIQESIANVYKVYMQRKEINKTLKAQIKDICPILIKGSLEEGKTYVEPKKED